MRRAVIRWRGGAAAVVALGTLASAGGCADDGDNGAEQSGTSAAAVFGDQHAATGTPVKVGLANAEDGSAISRPENRVTTEATVEYVNAYLGGLAGHPIDLVVCKDKSDGASGIACANKFVEEKVVAVVAGELANTDDYLPILESAGIPWVNALPTGTKELSSKVSFGLSGGTTSIFGAVATLAAERDDARTVIIGPDLPYLTAALDALAKPAFAEAGVEMSSALVPAGTPDVSSIVLAAMAKEPALVWVIGDQTLCQAILPAVRSTGSTAQIVTAAVCAGDDVVESVGKEEVEGNVAVGMTMALEGTSDSELFADVLDVYGDGLAPGQNATGFVSLMGLVGAVNQVAPSGDLDAAAVAAAMRSAKDVPLPGYPDVVFTCDGTASAAFTALCSTYALSAVVRDGHLTDYQAIS